MKTIKTKTHTHIIYNDEECDAHKTLIIEGLKTLAIIQAALMLFALLGGM